MLGRILQKVSLLIIEAGFYMLDDTTSSVKELKSEDSNA